MLPEAQVPKSSYNYQVFTCPTPESLQETLEKHKDRIVKERHDKAK